MSNYLFIVTAFLHVDSKRNYTIFLAVIRPSFLDQVKNIIFTLFRLLRTNLVELNIFTLRDFSTNVDRITAKHYGQWATRLYLILFTGGLSVLLFYGVAQPQPLTKNFDEPEFAFYNKLRKRYGEDLKCACSVIASKYDQFVQIEPRFHSVRQTL